MATPPTALVTNDDGIDSPGLHRLAAAALEAGMNVIVAAPAEEASGSSASIAVQQTDGRILFERRELAGLEESTAYAVEAGPGLIALLAAHGTFGTVPDVLLSGINRGENIGQVVLHSGTVGAALTAGANGIRAMALSHAVPRDGGEPGWTHAAGIARDLLPRLLEQPAGTVLSVNVPVTTGEDVDVRPATLAQFGVVQMTATEADEDSEDSVRLAVSDPTDTPAPGSDAALLAEGFATLTALRSIAEDPS
ncbi:MAG TPA: 5'/3'-nucleotidase SurE, partial [Brevibacterium sp.]|nr:5'/3'-nucleotidase SurE [Brevibacterium sp.]